MRFEPLNAQARYKFYLLTKNASNQSVVFQSAFYTTSATHQTLIPLPYIRSSINVNDLNSSAWNHLALTKDSNNLVSFLINGVTVVSGTVSTIGTASEYRVGWSGIAGGNYKYWDELSLRKGTSGITFDAVQNDVTTQAFLYHFEELTTPQDDISTLPIAHSGSAGITSVSSVSAAIGYVATSQAAISVSSSVVALGGKLKEINLVAFDDAELSATATRIKSLASDITSAVSVSANAVKTTVTQSTIQSVVSQSTTVSANRNAVITTQAISSQLSAVVRLAGLFADDLCEFTVTTVGRRTASAQGGLETITSQLTVTAFNIKQLSSALQSSATLTANAVVAKVSSGSFNSNFAQTAAGNRIRFSAMSAAAVSQVTATGINLGQIECNSATCYCHCQCHSQSPTQR